ncbi:hypothetical protein HPP92_016046 [Vanilla planifolia]|uniref:Uncharacterized protein n=1 Tax=Vanilla planifolia TaxID=51239 RepID=A0A835USB5_VANPL|nr:hypothetical protein HPP92_016646 [Vanilla planifolia]KAG0471500.1 hypothetical protein HPP92_016046 [Vanilla planifolia]
MKKIENSSKERGNKENRKKHNKKDSSQFMHSTFEQKCRRNFRHNKSGKHDVNDKIFPEKSDKKVISEKSSMYNIPSNAHVISLRKRVDPETAKYFSEIANLFESNEVDLEVRPTVCANALEETRGKEVELSTDMIISRTIQCLLEGCDLEQLCSFYNGCAEGFSVIAVDKFGSHVAETAMKSLAMHLHDDQSYSMVEETLHKICEVVVADIVNLMCSPYGSHVLGAFFCLLKGVELNTLEEFHVTKPSAILMERLSFTPAQPRGSIPKNLQNSFTDVFVFLVQETLNHVQAEISTLRSDRYSSFVLQSILKLLVGDDQALLHAILILLGCQEDNCLESKLSDSTHQKVKEVVMSLLEDTASSHLLEVIIQVAPTDLFNMFFDVIFKGSLLRISSHRFGNFVMQALIS